MEMSAVPSNAVAVPVTPPERAIVRGVLRPSARRAPFTFTALMSASSQSHLAFHAPICASVTKRCALSERADCKDALDITPVRPATELTESVLSILFHDMPLDTTQSPVRTPRDDTIPDAPLAEAMKYTPSYAAALDAVTVSVGAVTPYLSLNAAESVATEDAPMVPP